MRLCPRKISLKRSRKTGHLVNQYSAVLVVRNWSIHRMAYLQIICDGGLPFSNYLMHVDIYWKAPAWALWAQGAIISLVSVLYFFTDAAVEAVVSVSTIALTISYAMPIFAVIIFGMSDIPLESFSLGRLRPIINWVGLIYCFLVPWLPVS